MSEDIPLDEIERLTTRAMEENILILQALADHDRRDTTRAWKANIFVLDSRREYNASVGTTSGTIQLPLEARNFGTQFQQTARVETAQSVST